MATPPATAARFDGRVQDYARFRPGYPPGLLDWVHGELGVHPAARVADIGAGTGLSSLPFLEAGHPVVAVEPNAAMRAVAEHDLADFPEFSAVDGRAEATSLPAASVDLVACGQAFHWFDPAVVRREWARILRPAGLTLVFWNTPLFDSPFMVGYERLLLTYGTDYTTVAERHPDDATMRAWYGSGWRGACRLRNDQPMDFEALRGRLLSSSFAPRAGDPAHAPMLAALRELFDAHAGSDGRIMFEHVTRAFAGTLPPPRSP